MPRPDSIILIADGKATPGVEPLDVAAGLANIEEQMRQEEKSHEIRMKELREKQEALQQRTTHKEQ